MCFYNDDYDWTASVVLQEKRTAGKQIQCYECGAKIAPGESYQWIFMQEHEECRVCEWEEAETPCEKHDYGEDFSYQRCNACSQLLAAIKAVEIEEGCPEHAQQPGLCELGEVFCEHENRREYAARAVAMFPELKSHRLIDHLVKG